MTLPQFSKMRDFLRKPKSLRTLFIILFLIQTGIFLGLTYLLFEQSKQRSISNLLTALTTETSERISTKISQELNTAIRLNRINQDAITITNAATNYNSLINDAIIQLHNFPNISAIGISQVGGYSLRVNRYHDLPNQYDVELISPKYPNELQIFRVNLAEQSRTEIGRISPFRPTDWAWYKSIQEIKPNSWSRPHINREGSELVISTYNARDRTDARTPPTLCISSISLKAINKLLEAQKFEMESLALLTELDGKLIGSTTNDQPYRFTKPAGASEYSLKRTHITDNPNSLLASLAPLLPQASTLQPGASRLDSLILAGNRYYVEIERLKFDPSLDWLLVTVIPEAELSQEIQKNVKPILFLVVPLLATMVSLNLLIAQAIIDPIRKLQGSARAFATDQVSLTHTNHPIQEISDLGFTLVEMAQQIQATLSQLQNANQALGEQKAHLSQILDAIPVGVAIHNPQGQLEYLNPAGMALLELRATPLSPGPDSLNLDLHFLQAGQNRPYPRDLLPAVQALRGQASELDDLEFRHGESSHTFKAYGTPIYNQVNEITAALVIFMDITERKHLEQILQNYNQTLSEEVRIRTQALQKSEEKFRFALQSTDTSWWDWDIQTNKVDWSDTFDQMVGRAPNSYPKTAASFLSFLHPDDVEPTRAKLMQAVEQGVPYKTEFRFVHPDGSIRWIMATGTVQRDETGRPIRMSGINLDINERKEIENALRKSQERLRMALESTSTSWWERDLITNVSTWSENTDYALGYSPDSYPKNQDTFLKLLHPEDRDQVVAAVEQAIATGIPYQGEFRLVRADGGAIWIMGTGYVEYDDSGRPIRMSGLNVNITPLKEAQRELEQVNTELERLTQIDSLTGVYNRRYFDQALGQEWQLASRAGDSLALLMLDIDYFKDYNDTLGHQAGDSCLIQVVQTLQQVIHRPSDLVARYGGEEFVLILPRTDLPGAIVIAHRIQNLLSQQNLPHPTSPISPQITVSIGIQCGVPKPSEHLHSWLKAADDALYLAKQRGRNQFVVSGAAI